MDHIFGGFLQFESVILHLLERIMCFIWFYEREHEGEKLLYSFLSEQNVWVLKH